MKEYIWLGVVALGYGFIFGYDNKRFLFRKIIRHRHWPDNLVASVKAIDYNRQSFYLEMITDKQRWDQEIDFQYFSDETLMILNKNKSHMPEWF